MPKSRNNESTAALHGAWAARVCASMEKAGVSGSDVARAIGVSPQVVSDWRAGRCLPSVENLIAFSDLVGESADFLLSDDERLGGPESKESSTSSLNQLISRRAHTEIEKAQADAKAEDRNLSQREIAARMAEYMNAKFESVLKYLRRALGGESVWRVDYLEALAWALEKTPSDFIVPAADPAPEATKAQIRLSRVATRLSSAQIRKVSALGNKALDDPAYADLLIELAEAVLAANCQDTASGAASRVILRSKAFDRSRKRPQV